MLKISGNEVVRDGQMDGRSNISVSGATPMLFFHRVLWARKVVLGASQCILNGINLILDAKTHLNTLMLAQTTDGWTDGWKDEGRLKRKFLNSGYNIIPHTFSSGGV